MFCTANLLWALFHLKCYTLIAELRCNMENQNLEFEQFLKNQDQEFLRKIKKRNIYYRTVSSLHKAEHIAQVFLPMEDIFFSSTSNKVSLFVKAFPTITVFINSIIIFILFLSVFTFKMTKYSYIFLIILMICSKKLPSVFFSSLIVSKIFKS